MDEIRINEKILIKKMYKNNTFVKIEAPVVGTAIIGAFGYGEGVKFYDDLLNNKKEIMKENKGKTGIYLSIKNRVKKNT